MLYFALGLSAAALIWRAAPVQAHAAYDRSEPASGSVIPEAPQVVRVWFTQELFRRAGENSLQVFSSNGIQVDLGDTRIDDDDRTQIMVSLRAGLPPGPYSVHWRTLSAEDGDTASGEFSFTVDPEAVVATPTATPAPPPTPTPTLEPSPTPQPTSAAAGGLSCLGSPVATLVALGILVGFGWRRQGF